MTQQAPKTDFFSETKRHAQGHSQEEAIHCICQRPNCLCEMQEGHDRFVGAMLEWLDNLAE